MNGFIILLLVRACGAKCSCIFNLLYHTFITHTHTHTLQKNWSVYLIACFYVCLRQHGGCVCICESRGKSARCRSSLMWWWTAFFPPKAANTRTQIHTYTHIYTKKHACSHSNLVIASPFCLRAHVLYEKHTNTHICIHCSGKPLVWPSLDYLFISKASRVKWGECSTGVGSSFLKRLFDFTQISPQLMLSFLTMSVKQRNA